MEHIIHTQLLDISISHVSRASEVQQSLSGHFWNGLLPEINKLFDELTKNNEVLLIEYLEIDLGRILYKDVIKKNINSNWIQKLREQILQYVLPEQAKPGKTPRKIIVPQHLLEQWIFYMENGYLPWSINELPNQWERQILEQLASDYNSIQLFKRALVQNGQIISRIIRQHDETFLGSLLETILAESQKQLIQVINDLTNTISAIVLTGNFLPPQRFRIKEIIWSLLFELSIEQPEKAKRYLWIPVFFKKAIELKWVDLHPNSLENKDLTKTIDQLNVSGDLKETIHAEVNKIFKSDAKKHSVEDGSVEMPSSGIIKGSEGNSGQKIKQILTDALKKNEKEYPTQYHQHKDETEEELYFSHVGLILVHPFIILLFKRLGFTQVGQFVSNETRLKAIYLLHYITTGSLKVKEFELAIPKLFCGEPLTKVIDPCPEFNTEELEEAETMVEGAIAQWKQGLFSVSALRHNFLQRSGFWKTKNDQIILQLEKSSIDIILKTFPVPWNLSIVKFPWLKKLIVVEWV